VWQPTPLLCFWIVRFSVDMNSVSSCHGVAIPEDMRHTLLAMSSGIEAAGFALKTLPLFIETIKPYINLRWLQRYVTEKLNNFEATFKALLMGITEEKECLLLLAGDGWENANFQAKFALHMGE
jgi:hypothetical protein